VAPRTYHRKPGSGGARAGAPQKAYSNRSDLTANKQPVTTTTGQTYGVAAEQAAAQRAIPLPQAPPPGAVPSSPGTPGGGGGQALPVYAGELGAFDRPTDRPGEPVTAGIRSGPGVGPEALSPRGSETLNQLRAIYTAFPDESIREILEDLEMESGEWG
jgi:hypothetical protein